MRQTSCEKTATQFALIRDANQQDLICCPVCGFDYVHIGSVNVEQGHHRICATENTVITEASNRHEGVRGSEATIIFWCEGGHQFEYRFAFHKGQTSVQLYCAELPEESDQPELWRN